MFGRRIFGVFIVAALMLPAVLDCLISGTPDAQAMRCCAQVSCAPGHLKPACFSTTAPADSSQSGPEARASLVAPSFAADLPPRAEELSAVAFSSASVADAPQHSPPALYTLHLALLI